MSNSVKISKSDLIEFTEWLLDQDEDWVEEDKVAHYEAFRMRSRTHGDDPIIASRNDKNDTLILYGGRAVDLWQQFIYEI